MSVRVPERVLEGVRILLVEDEYFLADMLEQELQGAGAIVLGPVPSVEEAFQLLRDEAAPDTAVMDVGLGRDMVYPVADALLARNVSFLFTTGYDRASLPGRFAAIRRLEKPVATGEILRELQRLLAGTTPNRQRETSDSAGDDAADRLPKGQ